MSICSCLHAFIHAICESVFSLIYTVRPGLLSIGSQARLKWGGGFGGGCSSSHLHVLCCDGMSRAPTHTEERSGTVLAIQSNPSYKPSPLVAIVGCTNHRLFCSLFK